jgi:hypothetical protein
MCDLVIVWSAGTDPSGARPARASSLKLTVKFWNLKNIFEIDHASRVSLKLRFSSTLAGFGISS